MARSQEAHGPRLLDRFEEAFRERLRELGYTRSSAEGQVRLMRDLGTWLAAEGLDCSQLSGGVAGRFVAARRARGCRAHRTAASLEPLFGLLRELRAIPGPVVLVCETPEARLLECYRCYLVNERGLAAGTVGNYVAVAELFLSGLPCSSRSDLTGLTTHEVTAFVLELARQRRGRAPRTGKNLQAVTTGLRSLLDYLFLEARIPVRLTGAVPSSARWRAASLPRTLDAAFIAALLASCDLSRPVGVRDFAILTVLARLGLRIGDVAALRLDDVDWRAGDFLVCGKTGREERMPLPFDVGEALVAYLREGRPLSSSRQLFLRALAPNVGMTSGAVGMVVSLACDRAGLPRVGAHRLRHAAASEMLAHGASLPEIGQVLRHRRPATTAVYAKVDRRALAAIARPWPGSAA